LTTDRRLTVTVRPARDAAEVEAARDLRIRVFCDEQGVSRDLEFDGLDDESLQLVALDENNVIATCRLRLIDEGPKPHGRPTCKLERMAVESGLRDLGVGATLLAAAEEWGRDQGAASMVLNAQRRAEPFYASNGYVVEGETFMEAGIEHVRMRKAL
jgi:predicted GNAT family N-acyltransferase